MSGWLALLMWALAASALHLRGRRQLVRVARAGHEVRGPLCTAQLALDGLEPSARVEAIGLELRRATLALDDLSGRRRDAIAAVEIGRLLSDAEHVWRALAEAHGATLAVEPGDALVRGDRLRLTQACANLVANAIEHGGAAIKHDPATIEHGGAAACTTRHDRARRAAAVHVRSSTVDGRVRIEVRDFGPGLPAPLDELVAAARGRRSPRGHGLAIAAAVAERHGGRLVSRPTAVGAHLVLDLPANAS